MPCDEALGIGTWIFGKSDQASLILWLYGPAGAGKSAIAQTIAEWLSQNAPQNLLATFFFSKSDPTRNNSQPLIATLAYQMAVSIPQTRSHLEAVIDRDPLILNKSLDVQMKTLIVEPLRILADLEFFKECEDVSRLVIVDGLDECQDPRLQDIILRTLGNALHEYKLPVRFLIASRPEQNITFAFNSHPLSQLWTSLVLDNKFDPDSDIRTFLSASFDEIKASHPRRSKIPAEWPGVSIINALVKKSSGQFIYASVVQKYVSCINERPINRLEVVMKLRPMRQEMPFAELDTLYMHLLSNSANREHLVPLLAIIVLRRGRDLINLCDVEYFLGLEDGDAEVALSPLISILSLSPEVSLTHASLADFLLDKTRSQHFHIDPGYFHGLFATMCINHIMNATSTLPLYPQPLSALRKQYYSFKHLTEHLSNTVITSELLRGLKLFSLPNIWSHYDPGASKEFDTIRKDFIPSFINFFKDKVGCQFITCTFFKYFFSCSQISENEMYLDIYNHNLSSMVPTIRVELSKYHSHPSLLMLLVISCANKLPEFKWYFHRNKEARILLGMGEESETTDSNSFRLFRSRSRWDGLLSSFIFDRDRSQDLYLDGQKFAQVALRILAYLCRRRGHPHNTFRGPADSYRHSGHKISLERGRQRRLEKHQRGRLALSRDADDFKPSRAGLKILPELLKRSARSKELITFIRFHVWNIVVIKKWTRWSLNGVAEYLNSANQYMDVD